MPRVAARPGPGPQPPPGSGHRRQGRCRHGLGDEGRGGGGHVLGVEADAQPGQRFGLRKETFRGK